MEEQEIFKKKAETGYDVCSDSEDIINLNYK